MTGKTTFLFATGLLLLSAAALAAATRVPSLDEASGRYRIAPSSQIRFSVGQVGGGGISVNSASFPATSSSTTTTLPVRWCNSCSIPRA